MRKPPVLRIELGGSLQQSTPPLGPEIGLLRSLWAMPALIAWSRSSLQPGGPSSEATMRLVRVMLQTGCVVEEETPRGVRVYRTLADLERWTPAGRWV